MIISVIKAKAVDDHTVELWFDNGKFGHVDMTPYFSFGVFKALSNPEFFSRVSVANGTASWPGELEIAPDTLYAKLA